MNFLKYISYTVLHHNCSIYFPPGRTVDENAAYVRSMINETARKAAGRIPVYGFHWNCELFTFTVESLPYTQCLTVENVVL